MPALLIFAELRPTFTSAEFMHDEPNTTLTVILPGRTRKLFPASDAQVHGHDHLPPLLKTRRSDHRDFAIGTLGFEIDVIAGCTSDQTDGKAVE